MTRDLGAIVAPAIERDALYSALHKAWIAVADAERAEQSTAEKATKAKEAADARRLELGRALVAKKAACKHGQWLPTLADLGIPTQRASEAMRIAGHVESNSRHGTDDGNLSAPTLRDAGIDNRPRKSDLAPVEPTPLVDDTPPVRPLASDGLPIVSDEERAEIANRERARAAESHVERMGGHIDERAAKSRDAIAAYTAAASEIARLHQRGIYLNDVTTSPEDHERARRLASDLVEMALSDLERINAVDGKAKRAQLALLQGGIA